jgi:hypothetical protein
MAHICVHPSRLHRPSRSASERPRGSWYAGVGERVRPQPLSRRREGHRLGSVLFVGQVMFASCCRRSPARAARWPHPQRAARALGPPRRCRVEARAAQRRGETRRYPWGRPHPSPAVRCAPYLPHLQRWPSPHPRRPVEAALGARLTRSTGRRTAPWAAAVGRAAVGKAAAGWRPVPAVVPARRPVPRAADGRPAAEPHTAAEVVPTSLADQSGSASS